MRLRFILMPPFERSLKNRSEPDDLQRKIEEAILENPEAGSVVAGTGGVQKFRLADASRNKGTRGGFRIWFLDLPKKELSYLLALYDKDEKDDLSASAKKVISTLVKALKGE